MHYAALKLVHQTAVALSLSGFFARGAGSLSGARWVTSRVARTLPHLVDSILLASGVSLAWTLGLTPANAPWLLAKLIGLVAYVMLGVIALRSHRPRALRASAFIAALLTAGWIVSVAIIKYPLGVLRLLH